MVSGWVVGAVDIGLAFPTPIPSHLKYCFLNCSLDACFNCRSRKAKTLFLIKLMLPRPPRPWGLAVAQKEATGSARQWALVRSLPLQESSLQNRVRDRAEWWTSCCTQTHSTLRS
ncbi:hypothetical protein VULLAG_LOCUS4283 [Vulpes lagopus]